MDYVFTARSVSDGAFGIKPGPTKFLRVPPGKKTHTPDMAIRQRDWFDAVTAEAETGRDPATGQPVGDVLIYIHGFNVDLTTMMTRHRLIRKGLEGLGYRGAVVSFDWPCADTALNYLPDRTSAKLTAIRLVTDAIRPMSRYMNQECRINIHVLAHSMGAYVVREAFDDADDRPAVAATSWSVSQLMFCAADVSSDSLGTTAKSSSLYRHCVRFTNYWNPYDAVLSISNVKRVGVSPRAGRIGLPADAPPKAVSVDCGRYYDTHREDFAGIPNADHSWYFHDATFLKDVWLTIGGEIDRHVFPTRYHEAGRLHLKP